MIQTKETLDTCASEVGWTVDLFPLFNGNTMTSYQARSRQVQVETNPSGVIVWAIACERGWIVEQLRVDQDLVASALEWLS